MIRLALAALLAASAAYGAPGARRERFELRAVDEDAAPMRALAEAVRRDSTAVRAGVRVGGEEWYGQDASAHRDVYLEGPTPEAIRAVVDRLTATRALPRDHELVLGLAPDTSAPGRAEPTWRSYYVSRAAALDGSAVADAELSFSEPGAQAEVSITLTGEGAARFAALTARSVGHHLAILIDGRVQSAPLVMEEIKGGRVRITLGRVDRERGEREGRALVALLRASRLVPAARSAP